MRATLALLAALAITATAAADTTYTVAVTGEQPTSGQAVTFTGTFPQQAFRQAHNTQFHNNPYGYILCQDQTVADELVVFWVKGDKNPDGSVTASSYPVTLTGSGACSISVGYWTYSQANGAQWNQVSYLDFTVQP